MPITIELKKDIKEAIQEAISPLLEEIEKLKEKINNSNEELLTPEEVCKITKKAYSTIDKYVAAGKFPKPVYMGKEKRWRKTEILKYLENLPTK